MVKKVFFLSILASIGLATTPIIATTPYTSNFSGSDWTGHDYGSSDWRDKYTNYTGSKQIAHGYGHGRHRNHEYNSYYSNGQNCYVKEKYGHHGKYKKTIKCHPSYYQNNYYNNYYAPPQPPRRIEHHYYNNRPPINNGIGVDVYLPPIHIR